MLTQDALIEMLDRIAPRGTPGTPRCSAGVPEISLCNQVRNTGNTGNTTKQATQDRTSRPGAFWITVRMDDGTTRTFPQIGAADIEDARQAALALFGWRLARVRARDDADRLRD